MFTATKKALKQFTARFELTGDECEDAEPWNCYSPDGDFEACFETESEALAFLVDCNASLLADTAAEEEAEREELVASITAKVEELGLKELRRLAKRLGV